MTIKRRTSYRLKEFAAVTGVTVKALRYYDRLGLLRPDRTSAGHRRYAASDLARLEQIIALRFVGIPLKQLRTILDRDAGPLLAMLRRQRDVLEDRRRRLDRAIAALAAAEQAVEPDSGSTATVLNGVIRAISMEDIDAMRKYYSEEEWPASRQYLEAWPSPEWQALYRDVVAALEAAPLSETAQALAARWIALSGDDAAVPGVRTGLRKAWADREHWPDSLRRRLAAFDIERATAFIGEAIWAKREVERQDRQVDNAAATPRVCESRRVLFRDWQAALGADKDSASVQALARRWRDLLDAETGGDPEAQQEMLKALAQRARWPAGLKSYIAALYETDVDTWDRVMNFVERAVSPSSASR